MKHKKPINSDIVSGVIKPNLVSRLKKLTLKQVFSGLMVCLVIVVVVGLGMYFYQKRNAKLAKKDPTTAKENLIHSDPPKNGQAEFDKLLARADNGKATYEEYILAADSALSKNDTTAAIKYYEFAKKAIPTSDPEYKTRIEFLDKTIEGLKNV